MFQNNAQEHCCKFLQKNHAQTLFAQVRLLTTFLGKFQLRSTAPRHHTPLRKGLVFAGFQGAAQQIPFCSAVQGNLPLSPCLPRHPLQRVQERCQRRGPWVLPQPRGRPVPLGDERHPFPWGGKSRQTSSALAGTACVRRYLNRTDTATAGETAISCPCRAFGNV